MGKCSLCGKEMPYVANECGECAKKVLQEEFRKDPELKKAVQETIEEMKKPENMKPMVDAAVRFMQAIQALQKK